MNKDRTIIKRTISPMNKEGMFIKCTISPTLVVFQVAAHNVHLVISTKARVSGMLAAEFTLAYIFQCFHCIALSVNGIPSSRSQCF